MNTEQERAAFKKHYGALFDLTETPDAWGNPRFSHESVEAIWYGWRDRAALQSQPAIDDDHLSIILDVYDDAMQKAFDGRGFQNPCRPNTLEHMAWEKGTKEGKKKRGAGLPHSIALQSQDREDAERYRWLRDPCSGAEYVIFYSRGDYGKGLMSGSMLDEAIDHARRAYGGDHE